jgi:hypothetical protein
LAPHPWGQARQVALAAGERPTAVAPHSGVGEAPSTSLEATSALQGVSYRRTWRRGAPTTAVAADLTRGTRKRERGWGADDRRPPPTCLARNAAVAKMPAKRRERRGGVPHPRLSASRTCFEAAGGGARGECADRGAEWEGVESACRRASTLGPIDRCAPSWPRVGPVQESLRASSMPVDWIRACSSRRPSSARQ